MIDSILFFGTRCTFADHVLESLSQSGVEIAARVIPGREPETRPFRVLAPPVSTASQRHLPMSTSSVDGLLTPITQRFPTIAINDHRSIEVCDYLASLRADLAVVCCYPLRLPLQVIDSAHLGGVNIHPSLLPAYRGPEPLFWIYRKGERESGVTIHQVDAGLDSGPILARQRIDVPIGMPGDELWLQSALVGTELLIRDVLNDPDGLLRGEPQASGVGTYFSWPRAEDLQIDLEQWDSWRLFHFCRGVIPLGYSPQVIMSDRRFTVVEAQDYADAIGYETGTPRVKTLSNWYPCANGAVKLTLDRSVT